MPDQCGPGRRDAGLGRVQLAADGAEMSAELRLLAHVQPSDGPSDDHALDLRGALEDREVVGRTR